ncbi:MAG: T9SS type A sorting domain-containing protein, partial [Flavobacteriales bacterium]|nr:T9SS type A sorting domain-containing protein [Flavobacteriales bacterium]
SQIIIYDLHGHTVAQEFRNTTGQTTINIANLASGLYHMRVVNQDQSAMTQNIIILDK